MGDYGLTFVKGRVFQQRLEVGGTTEEGGWSLHHFAKKPLCDYVLVVNQPLAVYPSKCVPFLLDLIANGGGKIRHQHDDGSIAGDLL